MKKQHIYIIVGIVIVVGIVLYFILKKGKKKKRAKLEVQGDKSLPRGGGEPNIEIFNDSDTYLENAQKYPRLWRKWYIAVSKKVADFANGLPEEKKNLWRRALLVIGQKEERPEAWVGEWINGIYETPEQSMAVGYLWYLRDKGDLTYADAAKIMEAAGLNLADYYWGKDFLKYELKVENNKLKTEREKIKGV